MHHSYLCYQLLIDSDIVLPELQPAGAPADGSRRADVQIAVAPLPADGRHIGDQRGPFLWMGPEAMWLQVPGVARYQVEQGCRITVAPEAGIDGDSVRLFLLGSAFGALLAQRGLMVMHGNAVRVQGRGLVCVGPSGAGKSTLAAALMQRGHPVLADDVVAINGSGQVLPGLPRIKLWHDAAAHLSVMTEGLSRVRPGFEKFSLPLTEQPASAPVAARWIYLLSPQAQDEVTITPVRGIECFKLLQDNLYRARILNAMAPLPEHLTLCGQLAARVRIARVQRPDEGYALDRLVDALLADAAAHP